LTAVQSRGGREDEHTKLWISTSAQGWASQQQQACSEDKIPSTGSANASM